MKRAICVLAFGLMFVLGSNAVQAATPTPIAGGVSGIELCPQFICGFAAFTGIFHGKIGNNPNAIGVASIVLNHTALPTLDNPAPASIYQGLFKLQTLSGTISAGVVQGSITLDPKDADGKLFDVHIMLMTSDFKIILFDGKLDHHPLIPTVAGTLTSF